MQKRFAKTAGDFKPLACGYGAGFATDRITVDGMRVRFMYREQPDNSIDSGWRFMAGDETDDYMNNAANHGVYDINTIANYDPDIVPHLDAPEGSAFERMDANDRFVEVVDYRIPE